MFYPLKISKDESVMIAELLQYEMPSSTLPVYLVAIFNLGLWKSVVVCITKLNTFRT